MKKIILVVVGLVLLFSMVGCNYDNVSNTSGLRFEGVSETNSNIGYDLFYIQDMPCMRIGRTVGGTDVFELDGVTCDWSKWNGNK